LAALAYVTVAGNTVVSALGQSACPRLAIHFLERRRHAFVKLSCQLVAISVAIGVASMLLALMAGRPILALLYNKSYADHVSEFVWLLGAGAITYVASSLGFAMSAARAFRVQLPLFAVVVAVTIGVSALAIPHGAIGGAALALAVAMTVQATLGLLVVRRALRTLPR
jgi:O-antigen/teichoic acid export membrane protein